MKNLEIQKLDINGNKVAVTILPAKIFDTFSENLSLRRDFVRKLKNKVDTTMIVTKVDKIAVKTIIFEPNTGDDEGSFSNMCGNGLRAVAQITKAQVFITPAGTFFLSQFQNNKFICTRECKDIENYFGIELKQKRMIEFHKTIEALARRKLIALRLCANSENPINGEPHLVLLFEDEMDILQVINIAKEIGYTLSRLINKEYQTNVTFVSNSKSRITSACTFERNLGLDPNLAVTGSCGTGAIAAADTLKKFFRHSDGEIVVSFPEDKQRILIQNNQTYILTKDNYESI